KHGDEVSIIIRDEGIGMKKESIDMAFQTYFSLEAVQRHFTGKYEYLAGGIGMGLSLSRMIMESHGGALKLESAGEGQGVTVTMVVPISKPS
ncbi:MAG: ATP-binding protein, partial [Nitrospinota bacterium]|nr:ATP-binding protein [Nitrospinota bacterium]